MIHSIYKLATGYVVPVVAVLAISLTVEPTKAHAASTYSIRNDGAIGGYTGSCADFNCDTDSGCRVLNSRIYDAWHIGKRCNGSLITGPGGSATCSETNKLCRDIQTWTGSSCTGSIVFDEYTNLSMCDGGGAPAAESTPPGGE